MIRPPVAVEERLSGVFEQKEAAAGDEAHVNLTQTSVQAPCESRTVQGAPNKKKSIHEASWKLKSHFFPPSCHYCFHFCFVLCLHQELCLLCQGLASLLHQANEQHNGGF